MPDQTPSSRAPGIEDASFRRALDLVPSPVWMAALDASGVWFNRAWLRFVGTTLEHALATPWTTWAHPGDYTAIAAAYGPAVELQEPFEVEARMRRHDGQWRYVICHGAPFRDAEGRTVAFLGALTDITEIRDSLDRMKLVLDHIGAPAFLHTVDGRYLFVNEEWHRLFNPLDRAVIGRHVSEFFPDDQAQEILRTNRAAAHTQSRLEYEQTLATVEGPREFLVKKFSLHDVDGQHSIVCGIATDVTEVRHRERLTHDLEAQLADARHMESLGVLAGGVAHDFNNLMQAVLGHAALASAETPAGSPVQRDLGEIVKAARRVAALTARMLDYAGRAPLQRELADVGELLALWAPDLGAELPGHVAFEWLPSPALPPVLADAQRIRQLVDHLVSNAVEAIGGKPGALTLRAGLWDADERRDAPHVLQDRLRPGDHVYIELSDTGPGISDEIAARLFEPFFTTRFPGRGLGLSAALGIARAHGGTVGLATAPGKGASFRVLLPVAQPSRSASRNASP